MYIFRWFNEVLSLKGVHLPGDLGFYEGQLKESSGADEIFLTNLDTEEKRLCIASMRYGIDINEIAERRDEVLRLHVNYAGAEAGHLNVVADRLKQDLEDLDEEIAEKKAELSASRYLLEFSLKKKAQEEGNLTSWKDLEGKEIVIRTGWKAYVTHKSVFHPEEE